MGQHRAALRARARRQKAALRARARRQKEAYWTEFEISRTGSGAGSGTKRLLSLVNGSEDEVT